MKKLSSFLVVLLLMLASFAANAQEYLRGDVDQNGQVNIADVTSLIDYLLNGTWGDEPVTPPDNHKYVDLGLPSGTLWATCNVGASTPEGIGNYFAWGETTPKEVYTWDNYKWCNGSNNTLTKYCYDSNYGTVDNLTELEPEDDAAYVNWGPWWRMPTKEQLDELMNNCTWLWATVNGMDGYSIIGPNGASIFLPAGGYHLSLLSDVGSIGIYWSRMLRSNDPGYACGIYFGNGYYASHINSRSYGFTVRAVRVSQD